MTLSFVLYMSAISVAFVLMLIAWFKMIGFFRRNRQPEQDTLNPLNGPRLWIRFFTPGAFGPDLEAERTGIARLYILALGFFLVAVVLFVVLPVVPDTPANP